MQKYFAKMNEINHLFIGGVVHIWLEEVYIEFLLCP